MSKNQIIRLMSFCVAFICLIAGGCEVWSAQVWDADTIRLQIEQAIPVPGHSVEVSVWMQNPKKVTSFQLHIMLGGWDLINFHTDSIYVDSLQVPIDTCPDPDIICTIDTCIYNCDTIPGNDICPCLEWRDVPVRVCSLDTAGSLISGFETISCHGDTADTSRDSCKWISVYGYAGYDSGTQTFKYIPASGNYRLLFKFGVDLFCKYDSDTGRNVLFLISPGFSNFSDNYGTTVPFSYSPIGELFAWWSKPGDANNDGVVSSADIVFLVNYLFIHGPSPCIREAGDADSSCQISSADVVYLINYLFTHGPQPKPAWPCPHPKSEERRLDNEEFELFENQNLKPLLERR